MGSRSDAIAMRGPDLNERAASYQAGFTRRWGHLHNPHVRALAWLLDSPDLLDPQAAEWAGKLAAPTLITAGLRDWLGRIDRDPASLLAALGTRPHTRLGLYAEQLMAFYYQAHGRLVAHGLQVRASRNDTVGEFDFLLELDGEGEGAQAAGVEHIELATKFYLLQGDAASRFDTLIGPNLADSLGAKMRKILGKQLALADHPAAQALLARPVLRARALVKGWLFYPAAATPMAGIAAGHCSGFWCPLAAVPGMAAAGWVILPRLQWLAPYRLEAGAALLDGAGLAAAVAAAFALSPAPVMVASMASMAATGAARDELVEQCRGFIVPDDWQARALQRQQGL
jgi:hypothetical protein